MGAIDEMRGRLKEAAGALTGNKDLKRSGKVDQATGKAKDVVENLREKADHAVETIKDRAEARSDDSSKS